MLVAKTYQIFTWESTAPADNTNNTPVATLDKVYCRSIDCKIVTIARKAGNRRVRMHIKSIKDADGKHGF